MNDDCAAKNLRDAETPGEHGHIRLPMAGKEGRQIPGMIGMRATAGIKVAAGICKFLAGAGRSLMDMEAKNTAGAGLTSHGKPGHIGDYNGARVGGEEGHRAGKARRFRAVLEPGDGGRPWQNSVMMAHLPQTIAHGTKKSTDKTRAFL